MGIKIDYCSKISPIWNCLEPSSPLKLKHPRLGLFVKPGYACEEWPSEISEWYRWDDEDLAEKLEALPPGSMFMVEDNCCHNLCQEHDDDCEAVKRPAPFDYPCWPRPHIRWISM